LGKLKYDILIKTTLGFEKIVAARIREIDPSAEIIASPRGFKGLVLVKAGSLDPELLLKEIENKVLEADKIIRIEGITKAVPEEIAKLASSLAKEKISQNETFAVRTTRRGRHPFTSLDVNIIVGDAVRKATNASVNLKYPDKVVLVEIIGDEALISIIPGSAEWHKMFPGKKPILNLMKRLAVIQMPYLGPRDAIIEMGKRIGREVQNFEVHELVIAPTGLIEADQLALFINAVLEGINSRYEIQKRSYGRKPYKVPIYIQDLHQLVRDRWDEVIIVFEPEGKYITDVADDLEKLILRTNKRVNLLFGSREGIPLGLYRYADLVIDIAPGITLSTDYAAAAGLIALITVLYNRLG